MSKYTQSPHDLKLLTEIHLLRYQHRIALGKEGRTVLGAAVKIQECEHYLSLWKEVEAKNYQYESLSAEAKQEVNDAIADYG